MLALLGRSLSIRSLVARYRQLRRPDPAARQPGRLLVVDSIAHLFRDAGAAAGGAPGGAGAAAAAYGARAGLLFRIAALLKRYADEFQLAVVVTNQARPGPGAAALVENPALPNPNTDDFQLAVVVTSQARRARARHCVHLCTTLVRCMERVHHALGGLAATARSSHARRLRDASSDACLLFFFCP